MSIVINNVNHKNYKAVKDYEAREYRRLQRKERDTKLSLYKRLFDVCEKHEANKEKAKKVQRVFGFDLSDKTQRTLWKKHGGKIIKAMKSRKYTDEFNETSNDLSDVISDKIKALDEQIKRNAEKNNAMDYYIAKQQAKENKKFWKRGKVDTFFTLKFSWMNFESGNGFDSEQEEAMHIDPDNGRLISIQETNVTLKLAGLLEEGQKALKDVFIMSLRHDKKDESAKQKIEKFILDGVYINGVKYEIFMQTASQERSSHVYICPSEKVMAYRKMICNGVDFECAVETLGKLEKRIALAASAGYILANRDKDGRIIGYYDWSVKYVKDAVSTINKTIVQPIEGEIDLSETEKQYKIIGIETLVKEELEKQYKNGEITKEYYDEKMECFINKECPDGMGLIDIRVAAHWAYLLGCINLKEYSFFVANFKSFKKEDFNDKLMAVFNKIPTTYQIRHQFDKGLLVIWDLQAEGIVEQIVMNESMHKRNEAGVTDSTWRVLNYNKPKGSHTYLTVQAIQALGLDGDLLCDLADDTLRFFLKALNTPEGALEYLNVHDEDVEDNTIASNVMQMIKANKYSLYSEYVQTALINMMKTQIHAMCLGRLVVPGTYYYMAMDPRLILGRKNECLKSGQYYLNGLEQDVTAVRYPCVSVFEPQRLSLIKDNDLWFLKDILVFNPHDGTEKGMGGADFDGDIAQIIFHEEILKNARIWDKICNIITHDNSQKEEVNSENLKKMYLDSYSGNDVGMLSNIAFRFTSMTIHNGKLSNKDELEQYFMNMVAFSNMIGKEIDRPKTKENFQLVTSLTDSVKKYNPDWLIVKKLVDAKDYSANFSEAYPKAIKSNCPMGKLFRYLRSRFKMFTGNENNTMDFVLGLSKGCDENTYQASLLRKISIDKLEATKVAMNGLYNCYVEEMKRVSSKYQGLNDEETLKEKNLEFKQVYNLFNEFFTAICYTRGFNKHTAAYCLLAIPHEHNEAIKSQIGKINPETGKVIKKRSLSCAYNICFDYVLDLVRAAGNGDVHVEVPDCLDGTIITVWDNTIIVDGWEYKTKLKDGYYTAHNNKNGSFVIVQCEQINYPVNAGEIIDMTNRNQKALKGYNNVKDDLETLEKALEKDITCYFTLTFTKDFCLQYPGKVITHVVENSKEFVVSATTVNGTPYTVMKTMVDGEMQIVGGLNGITTDLIGMRFEIDERVFEYANFFSTKGRKYPNGKYVREAVRFLASFVGFDEAEQENYRTNYAGFKFTDELSEAVGHEEDFSNYQVEDYTSEDMYRDIEEGYGLTEEDDVRVVEDFEDDFEDRFKSFNACEDYEDYEDYDC